MSEPDRQVAKAKPWEQDAEAGSFGSWLRRQREIREISLREISESSKISFRYLEALEQDRFDLLPASVFAKGFLREYAKFVGLDPDEVVNYYIVVQQGGGESGPEEPEPSKPAPQRHHWTQILWLAAGVALAFGLVSALSFVADQKRRGTESRPPMAAPAPVAVPAPPPGEPRAQDAPLRVTLDFTQNCWVEASVDGERRVSELRVQGESLQIEAQSEVQLSLNNVAGVYVEVNGKPFSVTAGDDEPFVIDLAAAPAAGAESGGSP